MNRLLAILEDAGSVGVALLAVGFLLWWVAYLRFAAIDGSLLGVDARHLNSDAPTTTDAGTQSLDRFHFHLIDYRSRPEGAGTSGLAWTTAVVEQRLVAWKNVLRSMVASAPLLGLLGTVGGMIETFATLHVSGLAHADASVAGGISTALLTTQFGLMVSVPGLIVARALDRFEEKRRQALILIVDDWNEKVPRSQASERGGA